MRRPVGWIKNEHSRLKVPLLWILFGLTCWIFLRWRVISNYPDHSAGDLDGHKLISWGGDPKENICDFHNRLIIYLMIIQMQQSGELDRKIAPSTFWTRIAALNGKRRWTKLRFEDVFKNTSQLANYVNVEYGRNSLVAEWKNFSQVKDAVVTMENYDQIFSSEREWITIKTWDIFRKIRHRFWICYAKGCSELPQIVNMFEFSANVSELADRVDAMFNGRIANSIGIHLRGGDFKKMCTKQYDQFHLPWICYTEDSQQLIDNIDYYRKNNENIFLATNHKLNSTLLQSLKDYYGDSLFWAEDLPWISSQMKGVVNSLLLSKSKIFLGSFESTFSAVVAARRNYQNSYTLHKVTSLFGIKMFDAYYKAIIACCLLVALIAISASVYWKKRLNWRSFFWSWGLVGIASVGPALAWRLLPWQAIFKAYVVMRLLTSDRGVRIFACVVVTIALGWIFWKRLPSVEKKRNREIKV
eukprot:TRINITY_DN3252_c0_g1_i2.p1 TRINITY_DN3252_c0_g1~~TRINITY_DN3252_c0_g1_i2.p1  ORF type:complete len:471 (-),score=68.09 TRINITY_DN3252_c0_g1_i2:22-1434(-)